MTRFTRMLSLFVFSLSLFLGAVNSVSAQRSMSDEAIGIFRRNSNIEENLAKTINAVVKSESEGLPSSESFVDSNLGSLQTSAFLFLAGPPDSVTASLSEEEKRIVYQRYGNGVIPEVSNAIAALFNPPASAQTYLADVMESAHIIPKAQAQGLGFSALDPILNVWKIFRNVAYLFFVIIFLIAGFMIMFRQKISGQAVVTAQQALPGVIVALIFVTFSYAIAGFLIDLMYLLMYLMIGMFQPTGGTSWISKDIFRATADVLLGSGDTVSAFSSVNQAVTQLTQSIVGDLGDSISDFLGWIGGITVGLIVSVAVLIASFKIFFELLKTYVTLVLSIATAPIMLMMGAIPGKNNFGTWIKNIAGNLLAFPLVLMSFIIYDMFSRNDLSTGGFLPPYLIGQGNGGIIITMVGIGILLIIPELITQMKKAMGVDGGIWTQLGGDMLKNAKDNAKSAVRAGIPIGTYGYSLADSAVTGIRSSLVDDSETGRTKVNWKAIPQATKQRYAQQTPSRMRKARNIVTGFENFVEGKWVDPNSYENILVRNYLADRERNEKEAQSKKAEQGKPE